MVNQGKTRAHTDQSPHGWGKIKGEGEDAQLSCASDGIGFVCVRFDCPGGFGTFGAERRLCGR